MSPEPTAEPAATVVVTTKNRRESLRATLHSIIAQDIALETLVIDDGSTDDTAALVRTEFPEVRLVRKERSEGLIVGRNDAARIASASILVSLDDDAVFSSPSVVRTTVADFDDVRIGAVAIPLVDVNHADPLHAPRAPDSRGTWVTATFIGTAYAVRRDLFLRLDGFRADFFHQGEEPDFCLRMLDAGAFCRLGRADPIHHTESPIRDVTRMDVFGRRNEILAVWSNIPMPWAGVHLGVYLGKGILLGVRLHRLGNMVRGIVAGVRAVLVHPGRRHPVRRATVRTDRMLRRRRAVTLEQAAAALGR